MKLSTLTAKLTCGTIKFLTLVGGLALAGAAITLGAPAASAQQFGIGVRIGGPRYVAPAPFPVYRLYARGFYAPQPVYAPGFWGNGRAGDWREHQEWVRHHEVYGRPLAYRGRAY